MHYISLKKHQAATDQPVTLLIKPYLFFNISAIQLEMYQSGEIKKMKDFIYL